MELRAPAKRLIPLLLAALALAAPAAAQAAPELERPPTQTEAPRGYERSAKQVIAIASRADKVRAERRKHRSFVPTAYTRGPGRWQVSWFSGRREVAQVRVDDLTGAVLEQWTGHQVAWTMARGYEGAFGRKLNAPYVWIPLCLLFLAPFIDPRRPLRILHLDLLVLLAFGLSHVFFNRGEIDTSVPLVYPVLAYLLMRLLWIGFRPREHRERLVPLAPAGLLALGIVLLVGFRVGLNIADSNVIDVGYAGVIGADRIVDGDPLYGPGFSEDVERGDTYGPATYLAYVPFEQTMTWSGAWDDLPAAHGAALGFDLLTLAGLILLGRRMRPGPEGRTLGYALGFAWATYPYALFSLQTNSNDTLVALLTVAAMLGLTVRGARASDLARGTAVALAAAAKFAPLALAPLFATARGIRGARWFTLALAVTLIAAFAPFVPEGGLREAYDRTVGYQASRPSPFSVWGQHESIGWLQTAAQACTVLLGLAVAFVPRHKAPVQVAALAGAILVAVQLGVTHWFFLYVVWFTPMALVAMMAPWRGAQASPPRAASSSAEREPVAA